MSRPRSTCQHGHGGAADRWIAIGGARDEFGFLGVVVRPGRDDDDAGCPRYRPALPYPTLPEGPRLLETEVIGHVPQDLVVRRFDPDEQSRQRLVGAD